MLDLKKLAEGHNSLLLETETLRQEIQVLRDKLKQASIDVILGQGTIKKLKHMLELFTREIVDLKDNSKLEKIIYGQRELIDLQNRLAAQSAFHEQQSIINKMTHPNDLLNPLVRKILGLP